MMESANPVENPACRRWRVMDIVVVCWLIFLASIIVLPSLLRSRPGCYQSNCASNLKQLHMAARMYADDLDNRFPPLAVSLRGRETSKGWVKYSGNPYDVAERRFDLGGGAIGPYLKIAENKLVCEFDKENSTAGLSYAMNGCLTYSGTQPRRGRRSTDLNKSGVWVMFAEEAARIPAELDEGRSHTSTDDGALLPGDNLSTRHFSDTLGIGGSLAVYVDGHVEWTPAGGLMKVSGFRLRDDGTRNVCP